MNGYLLDTNILGLWFSEHPTVQSHIERVGDSPLFVSVMSLGEIEFGHQITQSTDQNKRDEFERFVRNQFSQHTIQVTRHTSSHYGDLKSKLFKKYPPQNKHENHPEKCFDRVTGSELGIDENDLWIAAQAIERNLILATHDKMLRIRDVAGNLLDVEDWTN